jgi:hypothetical protein
MLAGVMAKRLRVGGMPPCQWTTQPVAIAFLIVKQVSNAKLSLVFDHTCEANVVQLCLFLLVKLKTLQNWFGKTQVATTK